MARAVVQINLHTVARTLHAQNPHKLTEQIHAYNRVRLSLAELGAQGRSPAESRRGRESEGRWASRPGCPDQWLHLLAVTRQILQLLIVH